MMSGELHILIGPSGAGKTTYIKNLVEDHTFDQRWVVSSDDLRDEITGSFKDQSANDQVYKAIAFNPIPRP